MTVRAQDDCEGCGHQIGEKVTASGAVLVNDHVVCWDGIKAKAVTFHKRCNPAEPDLQRHHHVGLAPAVLGITPKGLA